jgi:peptidoglycan/LPS O-acetylase OafA/YrhL
MAQSPRQGTFYRPELDGLRFFAFLAVYLNHTLLFDPGRGPLWKRLIGGAGTSGAFGVDLFFVLSAYLITELLLREREQHGAVDVPAFYLRRVLRIWPLYFGFLAALVLVARALPAEQMTPAYATGFAFFCGNWLYMAHPIRTMAAPLWSVSVEEQFYLLWPWAVRSGSRRRIAGVAVAVLCLGMAGRLALELSGVGEPWISKNSLTRADGIAAGVLLAVALGGRIPSLGASARAGILSAAAAALLLVGTTFQLFQPGLRPLPTALGYPIIAAACAAILFAVLGAEGGAPGQLRRPALVYLGRISYGLYVFHQVGLMAADRLFPRHLKEPGQWLGHFMLGLACTVALAAASHRWLEQPFLALKRRRFTLVPSRPDGAAAAQA